MAPGGLATAGVQVAHNLQREGVTPGSFGVAVASGLGVDIRTGEP
jgi:hypothetical protein